MIVSGIIPKEFFDPRTGCLMQNRSNGDRYVDSMFLTCNSAYQLDDDDYFHLKHPSFRVKYVGADPTNRFVMYSRYPYNEKSGRKNTSYRNLSRDNFIGMLVCLGHFKYKDELREEMEKIFNRFSFYQNDRTYLDHKPKIRDFAGPVTWAVIFKGLGYSNILLLDFLVLLMSLFTVIKSWIAPKHASTVFHEVSAFHYLRKNSTFCELSWRIYVKYRRGVREFPAECGVLSALRYYSRAKYDPPIYKVTEQLLRKEGLI
jgi:hypothetical protein